MSTVASPLLALQWTPLLTAVVWVGIAIRQVAREQYRTWTETLFLITCLAIGAYAFGNVLALNAGSADAAWAVAVVSQASVSLAATSFLLFGISLYGRPRKALALAYIPLAGFLALLPTQIFPGVQGQGPPYALVYGPLALPWTLFTLGSFLGGILYLGRAYRVVTRSDPEVGGRAWSLVLSLVLTFVLGTISIVAGVWSRGAIVPIFSTLLAVPGIFTFRALSPSTDERVLRALSAWKARDYTILAAFLTYEDGTLIESRKPAPTTGVDPDLFAMTWDTIQNYLRASLGSPGALRSISHGDFDLVAERADHVALTLFLRGRANDQLRRRMRDMLLQYEDRNRRVLADWRGSPSDAIGSGELLRAVFGPDGGTVGLFRGPRPVADQQVHHPDEVGD